MPRKIGLLILGLTFCLCTGCAVNPVTGQEELMFFPQGQDVEIGQKYAPEVEKQLTGRIDDQQLQNYIDYVGQKIVRVSHNADFDFHFAAVKDKSVNALSLPGGYVYIAAGMLEKLRTEAQLAAVLSHEIVHVVARDSMNAMSNQIGLELLLSAAISDKTPQGVATAANLTKRIFSLRYSRQDEQTADETAVDYMVAAGYNPYGMIETMQLLQNEHGTTTIDFLSTHPSPQNRIVYLTQRINARYNNLTGLKIGKEDYQKAVLNRLPRY